MEQEHLISLTADVVAAHVANNNVSVGDLSTLIQNVHSAFAALQETASEPEPEQKKALVSPRASIKPDYLICMECGSRQKMMKRHLSVAHKLTPAQYRADYGLPATYPMVAPNYSEQRRALAHSIGLGRKSPKRRGGAESARSARGRTGSAKKGAK